MYRRRIARSAADSFQTEVATSLHFFEGLPRFGAARWPARYVRQRNRETANRGDRMHSRSDNAALPERQWLRWESSTAHPAMRVTGSRPAPLPITLPADRRPIA